MFASSGRFLQWRNLDLHEKDDRSILFRKLSQSGVCSKLAQHFNFTVGRARSSALFIQRSWVQWQSCSTEVLRNGLSRSLRDINVLNFSAITFKRVNSYAAFLHPSCSECLILVDIWSNQLCTKSQWIFFCHHLEYCDIHVIVFTITFWFSSLH